VIDWTKIKHFRRDEFDSPDTPGSGDQMQVPFVAVLDGIRQACGFPFLITSGFRTWRHNQSVGGKVNSAHTRGWAADISMTNSHWRFLLVKTALERGIRRVEIGSNWVHLDMDPELPQEVMFLP